jgi:curved DNA-binding protein CbpA
MKFEEKIKEKILYSKNNNLLKSFYFFLQRFRLKGLRKNYTVTGVDLLLDNFFKNINVKKGIYIDVGCNHPFFNNYTYLLNKNGWSGINIDLDFHYIDMFNHFRPLDFNRQVAISDVRGEADLFFYHNKSAINTLSKEMHLLRGSDAKEIRKIKTETLNNVIKDFEEKYNPYEILELKNNDNNKEHIKRAYKKLALKYHPDKAGEKYTQQFQLITQSYIYLLKKSDQENEIKNKMSVKVENKDYEDDVNEQVHNIHLNKDKFDINTFNTIFEKYKVPDVYDDGYNDLLNEKMEQTKEDSNFAFGTNFNKEIFNSHFDKQKKKKSSTEMIEYNEPDALDAASSYGFSELGVSKVNDFGVKNSNNLSYTDYKSENINKSRRIIK